MEMLWKEIERLGKMKLFRNSKQDKQRKCNRSVKGMIKKLRAEVKVKRRA